MLRELQRIVEAIPHPCLAIQWDVMTEVLACEGLPNFESRHDLVARLWRLGNAVPPEVKLGYHLCYGDPGHRHIIEPKDTGVLVELANSIASGLRRGLDGLHLPVPRGRNDEVYFAPLRGLRLLSATRLILGLLHFTDGAPGTLERVRAAQRVVPRFAIATECGFGRRPPRDSRAADGDPPRGDRTRLIGGRPVSETTRTGTVHLSDSNGHWPQRARL